MTATTLSNKPLQASSPPLQEPIPQLESLEQLLGTWRISGDVSGCVSFEWMVGGYFLVQHVELFEAGQVHSGVAYIGYEPEANTLRAIYFGDNESPLEYEWEVDGREIAIWSGRSGSRDVCRVTIAGDGESAEGVWSRAGGISTMRAERLED